MLTGDLLRTKRHKGRIQPRLVDPTDTTLLGTAAGLVAEVQTHIGRSRGELESALDAHAPAGGGHAVERGLVKLLLDRCAFETRAKADPETLREALFDRATAAWRSRALTDLPRWRAEVVQAVGASHGLAAAEVEAAFYADLEANQVLAAFDSLAPERLLLRYNVALVQGLLLRADGLDILAPWPEPARVRQLFRWLKFFGLLFDVTRMPDGSFHLSVDGPLRVLEHSSRYGLNLAQFFAALLLWQGPWSLKADVRVGKRVQNAELILEPHPWLKSPLPDQGAWVPEAVRDFVAAFNTREVDCGWRAEPAERIVRLPGNAYLIPDFEFVQTASGRRVLMEHVLYPSPERITRSLGFAALAIEGLMEGAPFTNYWIACKRATGLPEDSRLFAYRRTLLTGPLRERLEAGAS